MIRRRLLELGLVPETKIKTIRHSPLGDPVLFQFRGTLIALRREEARQILVSPQSL
jgi:ferrous iron transport protein A